VRKRGLDAVLDYTAKLDGAKLTADTLRVPAADLAAAHAAAAPEFLATIRRIRENILRFQTAILHRDVKIDTPHGGYLRQRYFAACPCRHLRARRCGRVSVDRANDRRTGASGRRAGDRGRRAADEVWLL